MTTAVTVIRTTATHACLPAEGGQLVPVPLAHPQPCFAVTITSHEGQAVLSLHADEREAIAYAERLEEELAKERMGGTPGGRVQ